VTVDPRDDAAVLNAIRAATRQHRMGSAGRSMLAWATGTHPNPACRRLTARQRASFFRALGLDLTETFARELRARSAPQRSRLTCAAARARLARAERDLR
jgi:hypothetical protein